MDEQKKDETDTEQKQEQPADAQDHKQGTRNVEVNVNDGGAGKSDT